MNVKILLIGSSFGGALKTGWDCIQHKSKYQGIVVDFVCLSNGLKYGAKINNQILGPFDSLQTKEDFIHCPDAFKPFLNKSWKSNKAPNLKDYDYFFIVDGTSPLDTRNLYINENNITIFPETVLTETVEAIIFKAKTLKNHPINFIKREMPKKCIFIGAPLPSSKSPHAQRMSNLGFKSKERIIINADTIRKICKMEVKSVHIELPPFEALNEQRVWSKAAYFENGLNYLGEYHGRNTDYYHANGEYGKVIMTQVLKTILNKET